MNPMQRLFRMAITTVTVTTLSVSGALASTTSSSGIHPYPRLVALGDSITFGYNLDPRNWHPSREAYPFLIGRANHYQVRDLGVPAQTSGALLSELTASKYMAESVRTANVITIDTGNDDILSIAVKDGLLSPTNPNPTLTAAEVEQFKTAIAQFGQNFAKILATVHAMAPSAQLVVYNLYNPIPSIAPKLQTIAEQLIGMENLVITSVAGGAHVPMVDAHAAFAGKQSTLIRFGDVHPTVQGQQVLATSGEAVIAGQSQ